MKNNDRYNFRIWDSVKKKMIYGPTDDGGHHSGWVLSLWRSGQGLGDTERLMLMQSTGLKDKNGVEIYEGSGGVDEHFGNYYVKFGAHREDTSCYLSFGFYVYWLDWGLASECSKSLLHLKSMMTFDKNIYENPEIAK